MGQDGSFSEACQYTFTIREIKEAILISLVI